MDFRKDTLRKVIDSAMRGQLLLLYWLGKSEEEVRQDAEKAVKNITEWLSMVFHQRNNQFGVKFLRFVAAEQEFNTNTYGIKGNIDSTLLL